MVAASLRRIRLVWAQMAAMPCSIKASTFRPVAVSVSDLPHLSPDHRVVGQDQPGIPSPPPPESPLG
ncbi:MAG: hypothetical protein ACLR1T_02230 [Evtepia gabavorous]